MHDLFDDTHCITETSDLARMSHRSALGFVTPFLAHSVIPKRLC